MLPLFGQVEGEGSKLVKLSLVHKAEHMEEGCLLLPRSEGWVDHRFNASGGGKRPAAASPGIYGGGSRRAYVTMSIFLKLGDVGVFFVLL